MTWKQYLAWASLIAQLVKNLPGLGRSTGGAIGYPLQYSWASLVAQLVKNSPAMQKIGFNPWVGKIPWRRERLPAPVFGPGEFRGLYIVHWRRQWYPTPVLLPGKSHGQRSLVGCSPWGRWESDTTERLHFHFSLSCIGEGNGNPLQCSCLENPRDGGAWWAAVYGVAQSWTRLKRLSSSQCRNH